MSVGADRLETTIADATCLGCGCLCDDIVVRAEAWRIREAEHACDLGRAWFLADRNTGTAPAATIDGRPATEAEALARAAAILGASRAPLVLGLTHATVEAQAAAVALADRIGATIDPGHSPDAAATLEAFQRVGRVSASLGEVKGRADVVVFWGVDPVSTHPRHFERYSVEPAGRFATDGRTVLVADAQQTATANRADVFLQVDRERQLETLSAMRGWVREVRIDREAAARSAAIAVDDLDAWARRLKAARYGALFFGPRFGGRLSTAAEIEALLSLVRDLNTFTRFVALPLGGPGNSSGADAVLAWQTGFAAAVDLAHGYPRYQPGEATAINRLLRGEADAAILIGEGPYGLTDEARERLSRLPTIAIGPSATAAGNAWSVGLASATPGIDDGGTVYRCDGATLPLRPALSPTRPGIGTWLERLLALVREEV